VYIICRFFDINILQKTNIVNALVNEVQMQNRNM
jgi:hypothetical protein